ncbi:hypothetical protein [Posidoniimonas polymericola]|uniref:hypothetical protein n=1 Tax=Posidoniimonas polymericola TaxID=2528002 RepID=UPI0018D309F4|nr:hypothetical protein [Posidoniimonas polymericola]
MLTTIATVGLIAAWAATSPRHWLTRTLVLLGVAALPLVIPAYELTIAIAAAGGTVVAGVGVWRWVRRRAAGQRRGSQFAMRDLLLAVIPVAAVCTVLARMPALGPDRWGGMLLAGAVSGLLFVVALWLVAAVPWNRWVRMALAAIAVVAAVLLAPSWAQLLASLGYQIAQPTEALLRWERVETPSDPLWLVALTALASVAACVAWGLRLHQGEGSKRRCGAIAYGALAVLIVAAPLMTLYLLDHPAPLPREEIPLHNGIVHFDQARLLLLTPLDVPSDDNTEAGLASPAEIEAMIARQEQVAELVKMGLENDIRLQRAHSAEPSMAAFEAHLSKVGDYKAVARSLDSYASSLESDGSPAEAARAYALLAQYGACLSRGGLMVDAMVAAACGGQGAEGLYEIRESTPPSAYPGVIAEIAAADQRAEDFRSIALKEGRFMQRLGGWTGHLGEILGVSDSLTRPAFLSSRASYRQFLASLRLLQVEYALRLYHHRHSAWPDNLQQLTPAILAAVPTDPYAADDAPLRYARSGEGYRLYCVWTDGGDDHGAPPREANGEVSWNADIAGDLSLDAMYGQLEEGE